MAPERSSPETSGQPRRNLSLEALFRVTDTELQNISRQSPDASGALKIMEVASTSQSTHVTQVSTSTESQPAPEGGVNSLHEVVKLPVSEKGIEKYQLKSDTLEEQGLKLVYTKKTFDRYDPSPIGYGMFRPRIMKAPQPSVEKVSQAATGEINVGRKRKHPAKPGRHICPYCGRGCAKPSVLQKHVRAHTGERPYPCIACGFSFKTKSNLYKHCKSRAHAMKLGMMQAKQTKDGAEEIIDEGNASDDTISDVEDDDEEVENNVDRAKSPAATSDPGVSGTTKSTELVTGDTPASVLVPTMGSRGGKGADNKPVTMKQLRRCLSTDYVKSSVVTKQEDSRQTPTAFTRERLMALAQSRLDLRDQAKQSATSSSDKQRSSTHGQVGIKASPGLILSAGQSPVLVQTSHILALATTVPATAINRQEKSEPITAWSFTSKDGTFGSNVTFGPSSNLIPENLVQRSLLANAPENRIGEPQVSFRYDQSSLNGVPIISQTPVTPSSAGLSGTVYLTDKMYYDVCPQLKSPSLQLKVPIPKQTSICNSSVKSRPLPTSVAPVVLTPPIVVPNTPTPVKNICPAVSESVLLPPPSCEPDQATKALQTLEILSEKVEHAISRGVKVSKSIQYLPSKAVKVSIQISETAAQELGWIAKPGSPATALHGGPIEASVLTPEMVKERIQQLISTNAVIVAKPLADPPRAKRLSRQNSEAGRPDQTVTSPRVLQSVIYPFIPESEKKAAEQPSKTFDADSSNVDRQLNKSINTDSQLAESAKQTGNDLGNSATIQREEIVTTSIADKQITVVPVAINESAKISDSFASIGDAQNHSHISVEKVGVADDVNVKEAITNKSEHAVLTVPDPQAMMTNEGSAQEIKIQVKLPTSLQQAMSSGMIGQPRVQFPSSSDASGSQNPEGSVIKDLLLKGRANPVLTVSESTPAEAKKVPVPLFENRNLSGAIAYKCSNCSASFKMNATLVMHKMYYCEKNVNKDPSASESDMDSLYHGDHCGNIGNYVSSMYFGQNSYDLDKKREDHTGFIIENCDPTIRRKKGRPKGSKNRPKVINIPSMHTQGSIVSVHTPLPLTPSISSPGLMLYKSLERTPIPIQMPITPVTPVSQGERTPMAVHIPKTPVTPLETPKFRMATQMPVLYASLQQKPMMPPQSPLLVSPSMIVGQPLVSIQLPVKQEVPIVSTAPSIGQSPVTTPTSSSSSIQSLWKMKLKGKLLMKRSMSMERSMSVERMQQSGDHDTSAVVPLNPSCCLGLQTAFSGVPLTMAKTGDFYDASFPVKRRKLSQGLSQNDRPLFTRAGSEPHVLHSAEGNLSRAAVFSQISLDEDLQLSNSEKKKNAEAVKYALDTDQSVIVPVVVAQPFFRGCYLPSMLYQSISKAAIVTSIQQQLCSIPLPSHEGIQLTLPAIQASRTVMNDSRSLLRLPLKGGQVSQSRGDNFVTPKTPNKIIKTASPSAVPMLISPGGNILISEPMLGKGTVVKGMQDQDTVLLPSFLNEHSIPTLRGTTHVSFCCAQKPQPMYVRQGNYHKVSMYSNWRVAPLNPNPIGLTSIMLFSLHRTHYSTNPIYLQCASENPRVTHSSFWKYRQQRKDATPNDVVLTPSISPSVTVKQEISLQEDNEGESGTQRKSIYKDGEKGPKRVRIFRGGFKSNEEYIYIRGRGRGKYVCEKCGIRCKKPSMLKKHIRTHTDLRPYHCHHCRFSFKTKGNLTKHMKSKAHQKKCTELGVIPVPIFVDDSQIDGEALKKQSAIAKDVKILDEQGMEIDDDELEDDDDEDEEEDLDEDMDDDSLEEDGRHYSGERLVQADYQGSAMLADDGRLMQADYQGSAMLIDNGKHR